MATALWWGDVMVVAWRVSAFGGRLGSRCEAGHEMTGLLDLNRKPPRRP